MVLASRGTLMALLFRRREEESIRERDREHRRREDRGGTRDRREERDHRDGRSRSSGDNSDLRHRLNRDRYSIFSPTLNFSLLESGKCIIIYLYVCCKNHASFPGIVVTVTDMWWRGRTETAAAGVRGAATQKTRTPTSGLFKTTYLN